MSSADVEVAEPICAVFNDPKYSDLVLRVGCASGAQLVTTEDGATRERRSDAIDDVTDEFYVHRVVVERQCGMIATLANDAWCVGLPVRTQHADGKRRAEAELRLYRDAWIETDTMTLFLRALYTCDWRPLRNELRYNCIPLHDLASRLVCDRMATYCETLMKTELIDDDTFIDVLAYCVSQGARIALPTPGAAPSGLDVVFTQCMQWIKIHAFLKNLDTPRFYEAISDDVVEHLLRADDVFGVAPFKEIIAQRYCAARGVTRAEAIADMQSRIPRDPPMSFRVCFLYPNHRLVSMVSTEREELVHMELPVVSADDVKHQTRAFCTCFADPVEANSKVGRQLSCRIGVRVDHTVSERKITVQLAGPRGCHCAYRMRATVCTVLRDRTEMTASYGDMLVNGQRRTVPRPIWSKDMADSTFAAKKAARPMLMAFCVYARFHLATAAEQEAAAAATAASAAAGDRKRKASLYSQYDDLFVDTIRDHQLPL